MKSRRRGSRTNEGKVSSERAARPTSRLARWLAPPVIIGSLVTAFGACGNGKPSGVVETESVPECDAYASAYSACMARVGAASAAPAERHLTTLRDQIAASPPNDSERDRLRSSCVFGMQQLEVACR